MNYVNLKTLCLALGLSVFVNSAIAATHSSHDFEHVLNGIELKNACLTEDSVQTMNSLTVCEVKKEVVFNDGINTSTDFICVKWSAQKLSYPRKYTSEECVDFSVGEGDMSCKKYKKKSHMLPQTIMVRTWTENGDFNNYPGIVSPFTFPDCN